MSIDKLLRTILNHKVPSHITNRILYYLWREYFCTEVLYPIRHKKELPLRRLYARIEKPEYTYFAEKIYWLLPQLFIYPGDWTAWSLTQIKNEEKSMIANYSYDGIRTYPLTNDNIWQQYYSI